MNSAKTTGCSRFVCIYFFAKWNDRYKETGKGFTYGTCSSQLQLWRPLAIDGIGGRIRMFDFVMGVIRYIIFEMIVEGIVEGIRWIRDKWQERRERRYWR